MVASSEDHRPADVVADGGYQGLVVRLELGPLRAGGVGWMELVFLVDQLVSELEHDVGVLDLGRGDRIPEVRCEGEVRVVEIRGSALRRNPLVVSIREADHVVSPRSRTARRPVPRWCVLSKGPARLFLPMVVLSFRVVGRFFTRSWT